MDNPALDLSATDGKLPSEKGVVSTKTPDQVKSMEMASSQPTFKMTKFQIIKNLLVVSIAFLFLFTSFQSLKNLQSSLNREEGLGTAGLAIIYGALIVSCLFLPPFIINHLGCKWTVAFSMLCYITYMAANFYAVWGTIIPSAVILGLGAAPLWSAKCTYLTQTGEWYAKMTGSMRDDVINRFFGVFFMVFQTSQVWGNLISSLVFSHRGDTNNTKSSTGENLAKCGANDNPIEDNNNTNLDTPNINEVYTVCGIYVAFAAIAFTIVAVFLDKIVLNKHDDKDEQKKAELSYHLLLDTFRLWWRSKYQKLLVPLTIYSGIEQAFIAGDFTRSYVSCALGIRNVGFVMICFGLVNAACSVIFGRLVQYVGHIPFFVIAFLVHLGCQVTMLLWSPDPEQITVFYVLAALWGVGDAVIKTQINALYGYLFPDHSEAAFSNYKLWESLGFNLAFVYSGYILTRYKIYICMANLTVGMALYGVVEFLYRKDSKKAFYIQL